MRETSRNSQKRLRLDAAVDDRKLGYFDALPAHIVRLILSFLPGKEAVTKTILSKTCYEQCPVLNFDEFSSYFSELGRGQRDISSVFSNMVDESLSKIYPWDSGRKSIRFRVENNKSILKRMNEWLELTRINKFTDLFLVFGPEHYSLPHTLFASKSLTVLHLRNCEVPNIIEHEGTSLDSLQELHLTYVSSAERLIDNLSYICPSIVNFTLILYRGIDNLKLSCLDKLTNVSVDDLGCINSIVIKARSLRMFKYYCRSSNDKACDINVSRCRNLEVLHLNSTAPITGFSPDICSNFPFLKELILCFCASSIPCKIISPVLQILVLSNIEFLVDSAIDTPSLQYFKCTNPSSFPAMTSTPHEIKIELYDNRLSDASWFLQLRTFVENLPSKCMKLSIKVKYLMVKFKHEELRDAYISSISPRINVLNLDIDTEVTRNYRHLIDGLLWSCHPETLSVQSGNQRIKKKFVKVFCHEFGNREIEKNCCRSRTNRLKCWRHYLEYVDLEQLGTNCGNTLEQCQQLNFNMKWVQHKKARVSHSKEKKKVVGA